jgi:hypothetical protein
MEVGMMVQLLAPGVEQMELIGADMLGAEAVG